MSRFCRNRRDHVQGATRLQSPVLFHVAELTSRGPIGQVAFRSFFSITPTLVQHPAASPAQPQPAFSLIFDENPLTDFVELPEEAVRGGLVYAKILEGVVRGAMEMASLSPFAGRRLLFSPRLN